MFIHLFYSPFIHANAVRRRETRRGALTVVSGGAAGDSSDPICIYVVTLLLKHLSVTSNKLNL
jgi:hypothetical protein